MNTSPPLPPPLLALGPEHAAAILAAAERRTWPAGERLLVEDGLPSTGLWILRRGSVELVHEGEVIQVLGPGECFGHPSLLTGMAPAFTVRTREATETLLLDAGTSRRLLGTAAGAAYVAQTLRLRLVRAGHAASARRAMGSTPIAAVMRPAAVCERGLSVRDALDRLEDGPLLVALPDGGLGTIGDREVREQLAHGGLRLDAPVEELEARPVPTLSPADPAIEATVEMAAGGSPLVAVVDGGRVVGMLSAAELLGLEARSPIALRHLVLTARDEDDLARAAAQLPKLLVLLVGAGVPPRDIGRVLSLQHDAVITRLVDLSLARHGPAPGPWSWLDLGSAARRELTLCSDQDNGLAYAAPAPEAQARCDAYFARLGEDVNAGLADWGFGRDSNGVLAGRPLWRMSDADWLRTFDACLSDPDESRLIRASVAFDFRAAAGGLPIASGLLERVRDARRHAAFMRLMARAASGYPVAIGFRGQLATEREGDARGRLDLKRGAVIPLVNLVRFHALAHGVTISPTLDRIEAVAGEGGLAGLADGLAEAFTVIARLRFAHHAALVEGAHPLQNLIAPGDLAPIARSELREALALVRRAQRRLAV